MRYGLAARNSSLGSAGTLTDYNQIHISATGTATTYNMKRLTGYQNERPDVVSYTSLNMGK